MEKTSEKILHIAVITNIYLEMHFLPLIKEIYCNEKSEFHIIPFQEHYSAKNKELLSICDFIVVWLNYESLYYDVWNKLFANEKNVDDVIEENYSLCENLISTLLKQSNAHIIWFLFEGYSVGFQYTMGYINLFSGLIDKLNLKIYDEFRNEISFINLQNLIAMVGISNTYDIKNKYRWNALYSKELLQVAAEEICKQFMIIKGITKKCIILDCDNVLWGGILSEDGLENIRLGNSGSGRSYQDFQRFILALYYNGVILAVCSKNDLFDVMRVFHEHSEMILKEEFIAHFEVNWNNKPDNIKKIAGTLNISLDSIVFIDDSTFEIEAVKSMLPQVTTILYKRDTVYQQLSCFNLKSGASVDDIEKRTQTYRTNLSREILKNEYDKYDDYLNALEIKIDIHEIVPSEYNRFSELTQRTNKCTNGKRYSIEEIKARIENEQVSMYSLSVSDRFSDLGLVGALEIECNTLILFSLSCRALGRNIEDEMFKFIMDKHKINRVEFISTYQNDDMVATFKEAFPDAII